MSVVIIIPARYASTRFPGKALAMIKGAHGRSLSLVERTWRAACAASGVDRVIVATDDARIANHVRSFRGEVVLTPSNCRNGTERCAAAALLLPSHDLIINLQGDAPLTPPHFIEALIAAATRNPLAGVLTPVLRCDAVTLENFRADRRAGRAGGTTAVVDRSGRALYFSKEVLPYSACAPDGAPVLHHVGVYAYRRDPLLRYVELDEGVLEQSEGLEQLRFLEHGLDVHCVEVMADGARFWEVNNLDDVSRVEAILQELNMD